MAESNERKRKAYREAGFAIMTYDKGLPSKIFASAISRTILGHVTPK